MAAPNTLTYTAATSDRELFNAHVVPPRNVQGDEEDGVDDKKAATQPPRRPRAASPSPSPSSSSSSHSDADEFGESEDSDADGGTESGDRTRLRANRASIKEQLAALEAKAHRSANSASSASGGSAAGAGAGAGPSLVPAAASAFIPAAQRKASLSALTLAAQSDRNASDSASTLPPSVSSSDASSTALPSGDAASAVSAATTPLALSDSERRIRHLRHTSADDVAALVPSLAAAAPQAALPHHLLRRGSIQVCGVGERIGL